MRILTCPPDYFDVDYVINPWMEGQLGCVDRGRARAQWDALFEDVAETAAVVRMTARSGNPDMCFTANAGLVESDHAALARFRMPERSSEEAHFADWFEEDGFEVSSIPDAAPFEGEGDALFQPGAPLLWAGYGVRTTLESHVALAARFRTEVVSLRLVDQRFYHLDTCFAPLPDGRLLYYPAAFDERSRQAIEARIPGAKRLAVSDRDAMAFSCNTLRVGNRLFMNDASSALRDDLAAWGFEVRLHPVDEFLKAGGGVKCLSLHLEQPDFTREESAPGSAIRTTHVKLAGHLLDQGLLKRALDIVCDGCGSFRVDELDLAERKDQTSRALLRIAAPTADHLDTMIAALSSLGADPICPD